MANRRHKVGIWILSTLGFIGCTGIILAAIWQPDLMLVVEVCALAAIGSITAYFWWAIGRGPEE